MAVVETKFFTQAKVVVIGQRLLKLGKVVVFLDSWLYSGESGIIRSK